MSFFSIYQQGFVRVAACTSKCEVANPQYNLTQTLELSRVGDQDGVALMVFPELGLSGYAIDDLLGQAGRRPASSSTFMNARPLAVSTSGRAAPIPRQQTRTVPTRLAHGSWVLPTPWD